MSDYDRSVGKMAPESIGTCTKCRRGEMCGPTYDRDGDRLRYECRGCGWASFIHCADHPKAFQEFMRERPAPTTVPSNGRLR